MRRLRAARSAAERGARLTQQLLAFLRKQPLAPTSLKLNQMLSEASAMLSRMSGAAHLSMLLLNRLDTGEGS